MKIENLSLQAIKPYEKNPRKNDGAVKGVAESIKRFGFQQPIVVDKDNVIVVGHTRYKAAKKLGMESVPCVRADDLTKEQVKAYRILDNKLNELASWDFATLSSELSTFSIDFTEFDIEMPDFQFDEVRFIPERNEVEAPINASADDPDNDVASSEADDLQLERDDEAEGESLESAVRKEWSGMPEIENADLLKQYTDVVVIFRSLDRKMEFAKLLGADMTELTRFIYYPPEERDDTTKEGYL